MSFEASDGVRLSGVLFEPERRTRRAAIFLHGAGGASVFDQRRTNLMAAAFVGAGIAYLAFDNRGSQIVRRLRKRKKSVSGGSAHERIREAIHDVDGAARFLRKLGYRDLTLIGHSTGANKIAVYDRYRRRNPVKRYVLLAGGDDTGLLYRQLGARRFRSALERARERRNSDEWVPASLSAQPMSWRAFYDMANPDGDYNVFPFLWRFEGGGKPPHSRSLFRHVRGIRKPALFVYGDRDEYLYDDVPRCVAILADAIGPKPNVEFAIMRDTDHGFRGREEEVAGLILNWVTTR